MSQRTPAVRNTFLVGADYLQIWVPDEKVANRGER
jgi:hypothetical protein